jgi:hypothetical protein
MYIIWFDDTKGRAAADKIAAGCAAYRDRFGIAPACALVNEADMATVMGLRVEPRAHISRNNFWIGPLVEEGRK